MSGRTCSARLFLVPFWQGDDDLHRAAGVQPPDGRIFRGAKRGKDCSGPSGRAAPGVVRSGPQVKIGWSEGHLLGVVVLGGASATLVSVDTEGGPCPASRCRTRATGWGVMGVYRDADRSCGIRYLSGLGGARRIVGGVVSCGRLIRPRFRFAAIASLFVLAAVLRRPRAARTSSFADSDRPASESGAAAPPLRAGLPSNDPGRGWDRSPLGGPWRQRGGGGPTTPKSTLRDHGWWCLVGALQSCPASPGAATAQLSVRGSLAGPRPELGGLGDHRVRAVAAPSTR